jgi:hypothetical protein
MVGTKSSLNCFSFEGQTTQKHLFASSCGTSRFTQIASHSRIHVGMGYLLGALLMLAGAVCEHFIGVEAAGKSLETISSPLQSAK